MYEGDPRFSDQLLSQFSTHSSETLERGEKKFFTGIFLRTTFVIEAFNFVGSVCSFVDGTDMEAKGGDIKRGTRGCG